MPKTRSVLEKLAGVNKLTCDQCEGPFGLSRQQYRRKQFCSRDCLALHRASLKPLTEGVNVEHSAAAD